MKIIDEGNRILPAMREHKFDLEDFFDDLQVITSQSFLQSPLEGRSDALMIDVATLSQVPVDDHLLSILNTHSVVILFMSVPAQRNWEEWLGKLLSLSDKVIAVHSLTMAPTAWNLLRNQLLYFWRQKHERLSFKEQMVRFSQEMDELIRGAQGEMLKAKKIHEGVVPKRVEDLKSMQLLSKYAVGEGAGAEYFDLIRGLTHAHLIFVHTTSYLASSCLMGLVNKYKGGQRGFDSDLFLQEAQIEITAINANKKRPVDVQILLLKIDQHTLQCDGHAFGAFELFSQENGAYGLPQLSGFALEKLAESQFSFRLERGEKVVVFSPGFIFNWNEAHPELERRGFLEAHRDLGNADLLMELFFQLKKDSSGDFLAKDAMAVMMEVHRHAIQQV